MLAEPTEWPEWWRGVVSVEERIAGDAARVGARYAIEWRSRIPYPVAFEFVVERVERPGLMAGSAHGDLDGTGVWRLSEEGAGTRVTYDWKVHTTKRWMNAVAPLARPLFKRNHDIVMGWGGEGLAHRMGAWDGSTSST